MYIVRQKETGTIIDHSNLESAARLAVQLYEEADKMDDIYEPDFYEVWNEEAWIYDNRKRKYYECRMMIPPYLDDNIEMLFIFKDVYNPENHLVLTKRQIRKYFGGKEFLRWWRKNHVK